MAKRKRGYEARLEKRALVLSHDPDLPAVCMKCGSHDRITREPRIFHWQPVWSRFLLICGIGVILMFFMRQSASLEIPLCPPCTDRWTSARTARVVGIVATVIAFATRIFLGIEHNRLGIGIFLATIAAFVAVSVTFVRKRQLRASAIDEDEIGLLGVHPTAIEEVRAGARGGAAEPASSAAS